MRVVVLGASGFVGRHLGAALRARGDEVVAVSLRALDDTVRACDGADTVVNLAGEPISQRWTEAAKDRMGASRIDAPRALIERFGDLKAAPKAYVSASAIGYYGTSPDATFVETSSPGCDFLAQLCVDWERVAQGAARFGARVACVRTGLALGTDGGALAALLPIFKLGLGGRVASGKQWYSWIHVDDLIGIYLAAIDGLDGPLNASAPNPVRNAEFTRELGRALHRPGFLPVPAFALHAMFGDGAVVAVEGQRVLPERTIALGYRFRFTQLDAALDDLFGGSR